MPEYVVSRVSAALSAKKKSINGARILLLGLAYKADVDDDRESSTYILFGLLQKLGAEVAYHDPHVPVIRPTREHSHLAGIKSTAWEQKLISSFDAVLISTAHQAVNYQELADWASCIVDTRNVMAVIKTKPGQVWKA
jgi:UDP-N-acetyl-D-glucosamine dehydrogenase